MVLVAVQRNMMRWGRKEKVYPSLSFFPMRSSRQGFHSHSCTQKSMLNSACTLSFYCHLLSTTNGCDYHCVNVPQTQNNIARVPLKSMWQAWGCVVFSNSELAEMSFWVFTFVYYCFYSCGLHIWHSTLLLRICIFIHHFFWPPQNFWISALDCTVTFIQQPLTAHRQRPLLVWCGPPAQWTIFRTNKWPLI